MVSGFVITEDIGQAERVLPTANTVAAAVEVWPVVEVLSESSAALGIMERSIIAEWETGFTVLVVVSSRMDWPTVPVLESTASLFGSTLTEVDVKIDEIVAEDGGSETTCSSDDEI